MFTRAIADQLLTNKIPLIHSHYLYKSICILTLKHNVNETKSCPIRYIILLLKLKSSFVIYK